MSFHDRSCRLGKASRKDWLSLAVHFIYFTRLMDMDAYRSTHPWYNVFATVAIKRHDDRDTLSNTGEVAAGGVLVGQERELTGGSLDNLLHVACKGGVAVGINFDVNILTDFDIADGCFINIGCNSKRIEVSNLGNH